MKKITFLLLFLVPLIASSQDLLNYKSGGRVFNIKNEKLKSEDVRSIMTANPEALKLYNAGKSKQTWGNVLLYGGIGTVVVNYISVVKSSTSAGSANAGRNIPYIVGAGMILVAIPIKIGFSRKIKKSVTIMNEQAANPTASFKIESSSFLANANGIGFSLNF